MKRFKSFLILFLILSIVFAPVVNAAPIGTISGDYSFGDIELENVDVSLYLIATVDTTNGFSYKYVKDFEKYELDVNSLNYGELEQYVLELEKSIKDNDIEAIKTTKTSSAGKFNFKDLEEGLYLVNIEDVEQDINIYKSSPSLLFIPNYDSTTQAYNHDVSVNIKTELVKKEINNDKAGNNNSNIRIPNTYDAIVIYVIGFVVSLILLVILVLFIVCYKKRGNEDEKKNK